VVFIYTKEAHLIRQREFLAGDLQAAPARLVHDSEGTCANLQRAEWLSVKTKRTNESRGGNGPAAMIGPISTSFGSMSGTEMSMRLATLWIGSAAHLSGERVLKSNNNH
jgi:hypothetical protein